MPGLRELLAVVLGVLLGVACLAWPDAVARLSVFGRTGGPTQNPREKYGSESGLSDRGRLLVRGLGVGCIAIAAVIAYGAYA